MTYENPHEISNSDEQEQQRRLAPILAANMRNIVSDKEFFMLLKEEFTKGHPGADLNGDISVGVGSYRYGKRLSDGSWEDGESLNVGFTKAWGSSATTYNVPVGKRIDTAEGPRLVVNEPFTDQQGLLIAGMVDELLLAKESGQIPNLSTDLSRIYIPKPHYLPDEF